MSKNNPLIEAHIMYAEAGFWDERSIAIVIRNLENGTAPSVIIEYGIDDLVIVGEKVVFRWYKRFMPLSFNELNDRYPSIPEDEIMAVVAAFEANTK